MTNAKHTSNVIPLALPCSRTDPKQLVVHSRCARGHLALVVAFTGMPASKQNDLYATLIRTDGRSLPDWLERVATNAFAGLPPAPSAILDLTARAGRPDASFAARRFRIDTATGAINWLPQGADVLPPLFGEQLSRFSEFGEAGAGHLAYLLRDEGIDTS